MTNHRPPDRLYSRIYLINLVTFLTLDRVLEQRYPAKAGKAVPFSIPYWPLTMLATGSSVVGTVYEPARAWWWQAPSTVRTKAVVALSLSSVIALWARCELGPNYGREAEEAPPDDLIQTGPYRWLRHPMYGAYIVQMVANLLVTGNPLWLLSLPTALAFVRRAYASHQHLATHFAADYATYMHQTPDMLHPFDRVYTPWLLTRISQQHGGPSDVSTP